MSEWPTKDMLTYMVSLASLMRNKPGYYRIEDIELQVTFDLAGARSFKLSLGDVTARGDNLRAVFGKWFAAARELAIEVPKRLEQGVA